MTRPFSSASGAWRAAALIHLLAAGAGAHADVTVALDGPAAPLDSGQQHLFRPRLTGAGDATRCWWAVTENGLLAGEAEGVRIAEGKDGSAAFSASAGSAPRSFLLRATSRLAPSAFAVVEVQVRAGATSQAPVDRTPPKPMTETKGTAAPANLIWTTSSAGWRATTPPFSQVESICWDPFADTPSVIALLSDYRDLDDEDDGDAPDQSRLLWIGLDGTTSCLGGGSGFQDGPALAGGFNCGRHVRNRLAALANGDIIIADTGNHRIRRIRDGEVTTLAGTGNSEPNGDLDDLGQPRLAARANLYFPDCVGVLPEGEVVFMEYNGNLIRKITATGHMETIAGTMDGKAPFGVNDLRRRYPATAGRIEASRPFALAPDGRIVFPQKEGGGTLSAILPDGTLATLASGTDQMLGGEVAELVVTSDNEVVLVVLTLVEEDGSWTTRYDLKKLSRDGRVVTLAQSFRGKLFDAPTPRSVAPASLTGFAEPYNLAATPGGGVMFMDSRHDTLYFLGPGRGELDLAQLADRAVAARDRGDDDQAAKIIGGLAKWTRPEHAASPEVLNQFWLGALSSQGIPALTDDHAPLVAGWLTLDGPGLSLRAQVALQAIDRGAGLSTGSTDASAASKESDLDPIN